MPDTQAEDLVAQVLRRLRLASITSNLVGSLVVFLFLAFVLPPPRDLRNAWWLIGLNGGLLALSGAIGIPLADRTLGRLWRRHVGWAAAGRTPSTSERAQTLRYAILPQGLRRIFPIFFTQIIELTKATSLIYAVGYTELSYNASRIASATYRPLDTWVIVGVIYFVPIFLASQLARVFERRFVYLNT